LKKESTKPILKLKYLILYQVEIYGSFASELCLPWSDIDVVITFDGYGQQEILYKVEEKIKVIILNDRTKLGY
jgi:DNA polymerase sigma